MRDVVNQDGSRLTTGPALASPITRHRFPRLGLAGRLILLIVGFVMTAEVMIFVPAVANMRFNWLRSHLSAAYTAALTFEDTASGAISENLSRDLLKSVGARLIVLDADGTRRILASYELPAKIDAVYDLRSPSWGDLLSAAIDALAAPPGRVLTFLSPAPPGGNALEVTMDEAPLQRAHASAGSVPGVIFNWPLPS